jgi:hypothetical protein
MGKAQVYSKKNVYNKIHKKKQFFKVDIEVLSVETHLQEMVYEDSRDTILSYLKEKVSVSTV